MLVERNANQKVELKERERMGAGREQTETQREQQESERDMSKKTNKNTRTHRKIRVGGNKHKELWLEFIQLSPTNSS